MEDSQEGALRRMLGSTPFPSNPGKGMKNSIEAGVKMRRGNDTSIKSVLD